MSHACDRCVTNQRKSPDLSPYGLQTRMSVSARVRAKADTGTMIGSHHGPSFARLYDRRGARECPETPTWLSSVGDSDAAPPYWADTVVDFRFKRSDSPRPPLPDWTGIVAETWPSQIPGWTLEAFVLADGDRDIHVVRFTDPQGYRFAIALSDTAPEGKPRRGRTFEPGRFATLFPTASISVFSRWRSPDSAHGHRVGGWSASTQAHFPTLSVDEGRAPSRVYFLDTLRDAVRDPAGWFGLPEGADWQALTCEGDPIGLAPDLPDAMGPGCPVGPARVLLAYAMAGYASYAEVQRYVTVGLDPAELARWREDDQTFLDETLHIDWFAASGGSKAGRKRATAFRNAGLSLQQVRTWGSAYDSNKSILNTIPDFEASGWTPEDVNKVIRALGSYTSSAKHVRQWAFTTPSRALAYLKCDYTAQQAQNVEETTPAEELDASLSFMVALREPADMAS